jgi:hypothetical protein
MENTRRPSGDSQMTFEVAIGFQVNIGHTGSSNINGEPVGFFMPDGG